MFSIDTQMTALIPSSVGMPACGGALAMGPRTTLVEGTVASNAGSVVRDRQISFTGTKTGLGQAHGYFPGTPAWRPPTC